VGRYRQAIPSTGLGLAQRPVHARGSICLLHPPTKTRDNKYVLTKEIWKTDLYQATGYPAVCSV
jgi:hypothetical protein